jgi:carotenoid 1,2-hydratase
VFLGSVFSPYYASARRAGDANPLDYCAFNVSLNGRLRRWSMTERPRSQLERDAGAIRVGASTIRWDGAAFNIDISERTCPWPAALHGRVRVIPSVMPAASFALDPAAHHHWSPLAPRARIEVEFTRPGLRWRGDAYLDTNRGTRALEQDFRGWTWSRAAAPGQTTVFYDVQRRDGASGSLALQFASSGEVRAAALPVSARLPASGWGITRQARSETATPRIVRTLVDAPFYARSLVATRLQGSEVMTVHESLDLDRFQTRWVQSLLPFRMPRWPLRG